MATLTLTRRQLYDRAWTTPIYTLARELGLSGRGLGKLCTRHDIPVPPRGYWARKAFGKRVVKPPLPSPDEYGYRISFNRSERAEADDAPNADVHPLIAFEMLTANRITVPDDLPNIRPARAGDAEALVAYQTRTDWLDRTAGPSLGDSYVTSPP